MGEKIRASFSNFGKLYLTFDMKPRFIIHAYGTFVNISLFYAIHKNIYTFGVYMI
jgi:hypothetical protein